MRRRIAPALILFALAASCAGGRDEILSKTLAGVNAAEKAYVTYDAKHQLEIVDAAPTREAGQSALAEWRTQRNKATVAFVAAYGALAAASTDLNEQSLAKAIDAAKTVIQALKDTGVLK